ncbi:MAG: hypothetical protein KDD58_13600 [Bdellovibrionales bacterium]|nr:hypothetical protein [Bdellovibrionales bacterium]
MYKKIIILLVSGVFVACGKAQNAFKKEMPVEDINVNQNESGNFTSGFEIDVSTAAKSKVILTGNSQLATDCSSDKALLSIKIENADLKMQVCNEIIYDAPERSLLRGKVKACDKVSEFTNILSSLDWSYDSENRVFQLEPSKVKDFIRTSIHPGMMRTVVRKSSGEIITSEWISVKRHNNDNCDPQSPTASDPTPEIIYPNPGNFTPTPGGNGTGTIGVPTGPVGIVKGVLSNVVYTGGKYFIKGWACQEGVVEPVTVHVYLNGPAGTGTLYKTATANVLSEAALGTQCKTKGVSHRFQINIPASEYNLHMNKKIYVHGIARKPGSANNLLSNSGGVTMKVK